MAHTFIGLTAATPNIGSPPAAGEILDEQPAMTALHTVLA